MDGCSAGEFSSPQAPHKGDPDVASAHVTHASRTGGRGKETTARGPRCGHMHLVGPCAACQRAQLARWRAQLAEAQSARDNGSRSSRADREPVAAESARRA
jgi:hypothetical protein